MIKKMLLKSLANSVEECKLSILNLLNTTGSRTKYLDCGCYKGNFTLQMAEKIKTKNISGIEIDKEGAKIARRRGITIGSADLNKKFPFKDHSFDVVTANQVIEHLSDTDHFAKEIKRVLKPNGYAIISTNNLASWHNIICLLFGYQPFPSDVSNTPSIGKLFKLFDGDADSFAHLRIFSYQALIEFFQHHGFTVEKIDTVGYYPFSSALSHFLSHIDKRHAAYVTLKVRPTK